MQMPCISCGICISTDDPAQIRCAKCEGGPLADVTEESLREEMRRNAARALAVPPAPAAAPTGRKDDAGKEQWSLLPWEALKGVVRVLTFGAKKYAPDNWRKVPDARRRYTDAFFRHFVAWQLGEKTDPETGESHLSHALCCLLFIDALERENG